jgi:hypothetical protein
MTQNLLLMEEPYRARWSPSLWVISSLGTAVCLGVASLQLGRLGRATGPWAPWIALGVVMLLLGSALFTVRSYAFDGSTLLIDRLFWTTRVPLEGLLSAQVEEKAMRGSIRTCGNGGLFSFTGWYWSPRLGHYRAYVTDGRRPVVLRLPKRTVMISPERPEEFVREAVALMQVG